jgi:hypothetical protein
VRKYLFLLSFSCIVASCTKETEVIPGNSPPPDLTLTESVYRQFINRTYILVHGNEPDSLQSEIALNYLKADNFSESIRRVFLDTLFNDPAYRWQVFNTSRVDLLNNTDTAEFRSQWLLFSFLLQDSTYITVWPVLQIEVNRLQELIDAGPFYLNGTIDIRELHRRMINNWFYDQINMGSLNFVNASFFQFLNRYPVLQEQSSGVSMVDGNFAILFLVSGSSKDDYLNILMNSGDYAEGAVVNLYRRYLQRDPGSVEMNAATQQFLLNGNYEQIQIDILASDEFAGI